MQLGVPSELAAEVIKRFDLGADYLGAEAYSLICALTNFSLPQRLVHLRKLYDEGALLVSVGKVGTQADADERLKMLNWLAVVETAMLIGDLAALLTAVERWRAGSDLATEYLSFERVAPAIGRAEWQTTKMWHRLLAYPGNSSLHSLGLSPAHELSFRRLLRETLELATEGMLWAREFLTPELRRVVIRYRHSLSVLSPASGPIYVASGASAKLRRDVGQSIVVLDADLDGRQHLLALQASIEDLSKTVEAAHRIANPAIFIAGSVLLEANSPAHRGLRAMTRTRTLSDVERQALGVYHGWPADETTIARHATGQVERNMDPFYRMAPSADLPAIIKDVPADTGFGGG